MKACNGYISSIYHGSAVDGKGLRSVVFFSGCNMRCPFCHNPETLYEKGTERSIDNVLAEISRYKSYYKKKGGVTLSGGEPFLQVEFCRELTRLLHESGINVIVETNGLITDKELLSFVDGIRLDVKNYDKDDAGKLLKRYSPFISACKELNVPLSYTNVLIPTKNNDEKTIGELREFLKAVDAQKFEFLAFKKICVTKYKSLGVDFLYENVPSATTDDVKLAYEILKKED